MYTRVASKLALPSGGAPIYSQAVPMSGGNAISVELTVFAGSGVKVEYEVGNDLENWTTIAQDIIDGGGSGVTVGYHYGDTGATIASAYIRLRYTATTSSVVAAGVNVASL